MHSLMLATLNGDALIVALGATRMGDAMVYRAPFDAIDEFGGRSEIGSARFVN